MEKKDWKKKLRELSFMKGYYFKLEDNGLVEKKDDQLVFNISLEKIRKVDIGRTVLANLSTNSGDTTKDKKSKELKKKTANKTSEGNKTSGDTDKKKIATRGYLDAEKDKASVADAQATGKTVQYVEDRNITENAN